jgi:uncharacterized protein YndB with AHSA1/START domain
MKFFKKIMTGLFVALFFVLIIGMLLPSKTEVSTSTEIKAPIAMVFNEVNDLKNLSHWSPWQGKDLQTVIRYEGSEAGVGAKMLWDSKSSKVGSGCQEIVVSNPYSHIEVALQFKGWNHPSCATWDFATQEGGGTKVTWSYKGQVSGNIFHKYMAAMMKSMIKKDYEKGLSLLKAYLEQSEKPATHEIAPTK